MTQFRRLAVVLVASFLLFGASSARGADESAQFQAQIPAKQNVPTAIQSDGTLRLSFGEEHLILPRGLQPSLLCTRAGTLILQAQLPEKPFPSKRISYPSALGTEVSRDGGKQWTNIPLKPGVNGLDMEGGITQLHDGTIIALDTYITPGDRPGVGMGQLY